jgi:preprotein translocase subunit YajC
MFISPAYAQTATQGASSAMGLIQFAPMLLLFVAFYFLLIRPQQKRMKALQNSVAAVKKGDSVVTAGGLMGKVTKVDETTVEIELAPNVKVRAVKATLAEVQTAGGAKPAND